MTQPNTPGDSPGTGSGAGRCRDPRLAGFAEDGAYAHALPSAGLAGILEDLTDDTGRPPPEATDDEVIGMLAACQALEARAHSRMLAVLRELIRRRPRDGAPASCPGDLPADWDKGTAYEAAAELGISWQSAGPLLNLAWDLQARLPGTGALLDQGTLTGFKARIVSDELSGLDDEKAAEAEKLLLDCDLADPSMTPGRLRKLCQRLSDTVAPDGARQRRETARRERARVSFCRSHGGGTSLFADGLPADDALAAQHSVQTRALAYRNAGICPDDTMDLLRVLALLDLVNQATLDDRTARCHAEHGDSDDSGIGTSDGGAERHGSHRDGSSRDAGHGQENHENQGSQPAQNPDQADGTGTAPQDVTHDHDSTQDGQPGTAGRASGPPLPSLLNLTLPLATLLGLAERPGEAPGYGSVDPALSRDLARAATASPRTKTCFTVTDGDGHATGHACARLLRETGGSGRGDGRAGPAPCGWNLRPDPGRPGPAGGYGSWTLTLPDSRRYRLDIHPVPVDHCDHRHATGSYQPGTLLRHLVEIRDGECVSPSCSHPARLCDYEHAIPHHAGGATCACNAGTVSRSCHRVKQSPGWDLSNPTPGTHRWTAPSGRTYDKGPKAYPA